MTAFGSSMVIFLLLALKKFFEILATILAFKAFIHIRIMATISNPDFYYLKPRLVKPGFDGFYGFDLKACNHTRKFRSKV